MQAWSEVEGLTIATVKKREGADRDPIVESDSVVIAYLFYLRVLYVYYRLQLVSP
jgi:hypothetical protein